MLEHFAGLYHLVCFYVHNFAVIWSVPSVLQNPVVLRKYLDEQLAITTKTPSESGVLFTLTVPSGPCDTYNQNYEKIKQKLRSVHKGKTQRTFKQKQLIVFTMRCFAILSLILLPMSWKLIFCLLFSCLQFVIAPYSLFISFTFFLAVFNDLMIGHYVSMISIHYIYTWLLQHGPSIGISEYLQYASFPITPGFIIAFFLIDQCFCYIANNFKTEGGVPQKITWKKTLRHAWYGFLNCKTYQMILLPYLCLFNSLHGSLVQVNLCVLFLDFVFGISSKVSAFASFCTLHWAGLFYHQHRVAHIPFVYNDAHKFHHYLHDTTAFDAHIYGIGMPEEFFVLWIGEVLPAFLLGVSPFSFNWFVLRMSWWNKWGHTRSEENAKGRNNHANHHTIHNKNFGIFNILLDMYFGTNQPMEDGKLEIDEFLVSREILPETREISFHFALTNPIIDNKQK